MALAAITIDSLSTNENYKTKDWKSTSKNVVKEAFKIERIQKASSAESMLPNNVNEYFDQLKDVRLEDEKTNPDQLLPFAMCRSNPNHILKLSYKINSKKGVIGSFTTSSLLQHPCYKNSIKSKNSIKKPLTGTEINEARLLLKLDAEEFAYKDIKPFTIVSGEGAFAYTKNAIKVGVMLGRMPSDEELNKLIVRLGDLAVKMARANVDGNNGNDNDIGDENDDDDDDDEEAEFNDWEVADEEQEFYEELIRLEARWSYE